MRFIVAIMAVGLIALSFLSFTLPALAGGNAERGNAIIEQWCRTCHQRAGGRPDPDMAPTYEEIVLRPGRNRAYFMNFLKEDHFPMTIFRLFDPEKTDVVAYLMNLQQTELKKRGRK